MLDNSRKDAGMTPQNPEALITIIIAGIGYGIYVAGEELKKRRLDKPKKYRVPEIILLLARYGGGSMMIFPVVLYILSWAKNKL